MKLASHSRKLPALGCAAVLSLVFSAACGEEAPLLPPPAGSAGTSVLPGAGTGTGGSDAQGGTGTTPTGGTGTTPTAGTGTSAGTSAGGTSSEGGTGTGISGAGGTGTSGTGTTAGAGGAAAGAAGTGAGGTAPDLKETVGGPLNGKMLTGPCKAPTGEGNVCYTKTGGCPAKNPQDPATGGELTTNTTFKLGGDPAKTYTITLHVQGVVESKQYNGATDQSSQGASPKLDGFATGGTPSGGDDYNVYLLRVTSPKQDYFLNSLQGPGKSDHTTYGIDYTAKIKANGGTDIRLVAADTNCSMIANCGPVKDPGAKCTNPITLQGVDPVAVAKNSSFNFNTAYNGQWVSLVVTDVTQD